MRIKINIQIFAIIIILILTKQIEIYAWLMLFALIHEIAHMITGIVLKLRTRMLKIEKTRGEMPENDIQDNLETAFKSAYYMYFRYLYNNKKKLKFS